MIGFFLERLRGLSVLTLALFAWTYGFVLLNILPQWNRLQAAEGGTEIQSRLYATPGEVGHVLASFDAGLRQDALTFYLLDVPNFLLLAAAAAGVMAFGLRNLGLGRFPFASLIALAFVGAAADATENVALASALLFDPQQTALNTVAANVTTAKIILAFYVVLPLMALLGFAGLAAWLWRLIRQAVSPRA